MGKDLILEARLATLGQSAADIRYKPIRQSDDYIILSDGRLYSRKKCDFLKYKIGATGYEEYCLPNVINPNNGKKGVMVMGHRLVAEAFLDNPDNLPYVHHKDENKQNNDVSNLQWVSASYNSTEHVKANPNKKVRRLKERFTPIDGETWKPVRGFSNYLVSDFGRIQNIKTGFMVRPDASAAYDRVTLREDGKPKRFFVHRLVWSVFNDDWDYEGFVIDHIDANPKNNRLDNLQKITQSENCKKRNISK